MSNKIILFYHLHKCAGTTTVELFNKKYNLHNPNKNGNPYNKQNELIPFYEWNQEKLTKFFDKLKINNVQFIATEWQFFQPTIYPVLKNNTTTLCIFRDPFQRILSNFNFDVLYKNTNTKSLRSYIDSSDIYTQTNYYTKIMSGKSNKYRGGCDKTDLEKALLCLWSIDYIAILEDPDSMSKLFAKFNVPYHNEKMNTSKNFNEYIDLKEDEFKQTNNFDYIIYQEAKKCLLNN
jgi:hypothetical protein